MLLTLSALLGAPGCGDDDGGARDAGPMDGGPIDTGPVDAGSSDGGSTDGAPGVDAAGLDGGPGRDGGVGAGRAVGLPWEDCEGGGRMLEAGPDDYRALLDMLEPGDTLRLRPGTYARGLPISRGGEEGRCVVIEGIEEGGERPLFLGSDAFNVIALRDVSWVKVRHLDLDGMGRAGFGVASQNPDVPVHHVVIEDLEMVGFAANRQITGISTKTPAWAWVIRGNRILEAGTGLYLGNSDGRQPFVGGLVEYNLVLNPRGYAMQIKHQRAEGRGDLALEGMPERATTIVRYNVFAKAERGEGGGGARPNLLVGHFPRRGAGVDDQYLIYGNLFWQNPTENLFQGEGNVAFYANLLVNDGGGGVSVQPHNDVPKRIDVFFNTILVRDRAIRVTGGDEGFAQRVRWNALFGGTGIGGDAEVEGNVERADASALRAPDAEPGAGLDLRPEDAAALAVEADLESVAAYADADRAFDGTPRDGTTAGAYAASAGPGPVALEAPPY